MRSKQDRGGEQALNVGRRGDARGSNAAALTTLVALTNSPFSILIAAGRAHEQVTHHWPTGVKNGKAYCYCCRWESP